MGNQNPIYPHRATVSAIDGAIGTETKPCNRISSSIMAITAVVIAAIVNPRRCPIPTNEGNHIPKNPRPTTDIINTRITRTVSDGTASLNQIDRTSLAKTNSKINKAPARAELMWVPFLITAFTLFFEG